MTSSIATDLDVLIIGAGQAGLATAYALRHSGRAVALVDHWPRVGDSWRKRYDSLVLFTPRRYSSLPGVPLEGDPDGFPTKDEIADYLERYCTAHAFCVMPGSRIISLRIRAGIFEAMASSGQTIYARAVVIATGPSQEPVVPAAAAMLPPDVEQWTVETYRNPAAFAGKRVLVVGDGASGRQIARELTGTASVTLATGKPRRVMPDSILGKSVFWWLERLRLTRLPDSTWIGKHFKSLDAFPGKHLKLAALRHQGIAVVGRLCSFTGDVAFFANGVTARIDAVIWAVGYRNNFSWINIAEATAGVSEAVSQQGIGAVPGLYFVGRSWQTSRGSALLLGVARDAAQVACAVQRSPYREAKPHTGECLLAI
jgi:putative flavoprotein involved in K+ transport